VDGGARGGGGGGGGQRHLEQPQPLEVAEIASGEIMLAAALESRMT